jgi:anti-anti-sigma regulatory factor
VRPLRVAPSGICDVKHEQGVFDDGASIEITGSTDRVKLVIRGALVARISTTLSRAVHHAIAPGTRVLELDLTGVTDVDPAGLAPFVVAARRLRGTNGSVRFIAVSVKCAETMQRLHLFTEAIERVV